MPPAAAHVFGTSYPKFKLGRLMYMVCKTQGKGLSSTDGDMMVQLKAELLPIDNELQQLEQRLSQLQTAEEEETAKRHESLSDIKHFCDAQGSSGAGTVPPPFAGK